jgi:hypothetical protein
MFGIFFMTLFSMIFKVIIFAIFRFQSVSIVLLYFFSDQKLSERTKTNQYFSIRFLYENEKYVEILFV